MTNSHIPIDKEVAEFRAYLESTDRAILSAKFGDGKSTFLKEFERNTKDKCIFVKLFPVNYQVEENRDIFELIKRDILIQLLNRDEVVFDKTEISSAWAAYYYAIENNRSIAQDILLSIAQIKMPYLGVGIEKLFKHFKGIEAKIEDPEKSNPNSIIEVFLKNNSKSIYEFDPITQMIVEAIRMVKNPGKYRQKKKVVLVVEDLDRIDPKHTFRILNVLSAHFDQKENQKLWSDFDNKFGFDKIILVCHFDNIKHIFHHLYGDETDFKGYMSKFSSHEPFHFSLKDRYKAFILDRFDKNLLQFAEVANSVADLITENELKQASLRDISSLLSDKYPTIRETTIMVNQDINKPIIISTVNNLTKLLDLLNRFSIPFIKLQERMLSDKNEIKLYELVGVCWLIPVYSDIHVTYLADKFFITDNGLNYNLNAKSTISNNLIVNLEFDFNILNSVIHNKKAASNLPLIIEAMNNYIINNNIVMVEKDNKQKTGATFR